MSNPNPNYDNVRQGGPGGPRFPGNEIQYPGKSTYGLTYENFGEVDLGSISGTVNLTAAQAAASLITATPSAAATLVLPTCQPGSNFMVQNLSASFTITVEVLGNTTNTAVCPVSKMSLVIQTGTNGGCYLGPGL